MGLENFGEKIETASFEKDFTELSVKEREVKAKLDAILQESANLNGLLLAEGDLDFSAQQVIYYSSQLKRISGEAREELGKLRRVTGYEAPKELQDITAAKRYYEAINDREAA